ncbi:MAG: hypothetical protein SGILL_004695 [Bacillariaceae sp.]
MKRLMVYITLILWTACSLLSLAEAAIRAVVTIQDSASTAPFISYKILNEVNETVFTGGDIAVHMDGNWCVAETYNSERDRSKYAEFSQFASPVPLTLTREESIKGIFPDLGRYEGIQLEWTCLLEKESQASVITSFYNFLSGNLILFRLEWPHGAQNTSLQEDSERQTAALATFPSFVMTSTSKKISTNDDEKAVVSPLLPDTLSWQGSFVQSVRGLSEGSAGGPTVFYNASDPYLNNVIIASQMGAGIITSHSDDGRRLWNTFTAGNNRDWSNTRPALSPGTSGRITSLPSGYQQNIILYQGSHGGITSTLDEWGSFMKNISTAANTPKVKDVTLEKIGIQTDNGAYYCFCAHDHQNCSDVLLKEKIFLQDIGIPVGYVSYQGAGTSSGRGKAAPWCVEKWSADGGQDKAHYPLNTGDLQRALGVPLQLYCPYFCPNSTYFGSDTWHDWKAVASNPDLPGCSGFAFETASAADSKSFFGWFMQMGMDSGMTSFESDFMNQNVNCVEEFIHSPTDTDQFLYGMADAAQDLNIPVQWCYASPNEVFSSLDMPSVTNFRVSFDFCYGRSYDIGESSLLVWALRGKPSKDTLWSTDNNKTETPGCKWTVDHEEVAAELHIVLALMTTGPFGLSDGIGMSNATLLKRTIAQDGTLLQPSKPITAIDSTFLKNPKLDGFVYSTHGMQYSWIFVSFQMKTPYAVRRQDFWPSVYVDATSRQSPQLVYRTLSRSPACRQGDDAIRNGCVTLAATTDIAFTVPESSLASPGSDLSPNVVTVWKSCGDGIFFLGEVDKYVALSPKRFVSLSCSSGEISFSSRKSLGEKMEITYLMPRKRPSGEFWYEVMTYDVPLEKENLVSVVISTSNNPVEAKAIA